MQGDFSWKTKLVFLYFCFIGFILFIASCLGNLFCSVDHYKSNTSQQYCLIL